MKTGIKGSATKFPQTLVDQTPVFDKRRKHNHAVPKHRGNLSRKVKWLK
jgi:hypothetical protein